MVGLLMVGLLMIEVLKIEVSKIEVLKIEDVVEHILRPIQVLHCLLLRWFNLSVGRYD